MSDRDELLALIKDLAVVHGKVILSSGAEADYYVDLRRVTLHHRAAPLVGRVMLEVTRDWTYGAVGGLSAEIQGKLATARPATLGAAARISGVTPAALVALLQHVKQRPEAA